MIELIFFIFLFLAMSGVMALVEASILSVSLMEVEEAAALGKFGGNALKQIFSRLTRVLVVLVIFTNTINVLGPILVGRKAIQLYGDQAILVVSIVLVIGTTIFSEIIPKSLGSHYAPLLSRIVAPTLQLVTLAFFPIVLLLEKFTALFKTGERIIGTEMQIRLLTSRGRKAGLIEQDEGHMIRRVFVLNDRTAGDIMTPLSEIVAIDGSANISEAAAIVFQHEFSRYPVFGKSRDEVRGLVLSRQILSALAQGRQEDACSTIALACPIVSDDISAAALLVRFRSEQIHLAVVQRNGRTVGLVSLEDVLEELVGSIDDEKDCR